jgi:hypothetical protein
LGFGKGRDMDGDGGVEVGLSFGWWCCEVRRCEAKIKLRRSERREGDVGVVFVWT